MTHTLADLDPRTPVLVGGGQAADLLNSPDYQALSPVGLAATAAQRALDDTGADPAAVAAAIDTVGGVRQFETSTPMAVAPLGRADNFPRAVAARIGADPRPRHPRGGRRPGAPAPRHRARRFDRGRRDRGRARLRGRGDLHRAQLRQGRGQARLDRDGRRQPRRPRLRTRRRRVAAPGRARPGRRPGPVRLVRQRPTRTAQAQPGTSTPPRWARCSRRSRRSRRATRTRRHRWSARPPNWSTPTEANRIIADPYPRYLVSRDQVNQGAAVLLMSVAAARRLGVAEDRWVFLHGHADLREPPLLRPRRPQPQAPPRSWPARHALEMAGIGRCRTCRPSTCTAASRSRCSTSPTAFGLAADDPRGLTLTGGLPFFGGAGNNYSMHAIAETIDRARSAPGTFGLVGANGGFADQVLGRRLLHHAGAAGAPTAAPTLQAELDARPAVEVARHADGPATIETYTVTHSRDGKRTGIVIGRLDADGRRFVATLAPGDRRPARAAAAAPEPVRGGDLRPRSPRVGNRVASTKAQMDELLPVRAPRSPRPTTSTCWCAATVTCSR